MTKDNGMTAPPMPELLVEFIDSQRQQEYLANALTYFAELCALAAEYKGFHNDEKHLRCKLDQLKSDAKLLQWVEHQLLQAELGRQASEIGEAIEAVRKPRCDQHCPDFSNFLVEEADTMIRIGDTCGKRLMPLGKATVAKMLYNLSREYKHGKNS